MHTRIPPIFQYTCYSRIFLPWGLILTRCRFSIIRMSPLCKKWNSWLNKRQRLNSDIKAMITWIFHDEYMDRKRIASLKVPLIPPFVFSLLFLRTLLSVVESGVVDLHTVPISIAAASLLGRWSIVIYLSLIMQLNFKLKNV